MATKMTTRDTPSGINTDATIGIKGIQTCHSGYPVYTYWLFLPYIQTSRENLAIHIDNNRIHKVRVIGVSKIKYATVHCLMSYASQFESIHNEATVVLIQDHKNLTYNVAFILCELYRLDVPEAVSILKGSSSEKASNILPVRRKQTNHHDRMFSLCLSPLHSRFNDKLKLVEWIELNMILGVDKIIVYVQNCSNDVMQTLKIYESKGAVDIMNWSLPKDITNKRKKNLHYYGQLAAINDCLYRNRGLSLYTAAFDIDEYIIPQLDEDVTWLDMLSRLPKANAYIFRNSFFLRNETGKFISQMPITTSNFRRENFIYWPRRRSKFIARTDAIYTTDIHFIREMNGNQHAVDPNIGLLHHYRVRIPNHNETEGQSSNRKDDIQRKYDEELTVTNEATKKYSQILHKSMTWILDK
ncbi:beta-1,4-galactosyltransferase galt-1-like [Mercenaria mercenaria]|uniref:beta-1,4-galactosyltransferase galt-1-like n=1 Tax=Mercenaria mercenaria TaxID=6596 RepID=UPI00234EDC8F|nr:beta-1,4-galactosyltransferase galt-1-like [Mercenaria mercenaria]